jgi:hypothetical protein
MHAGSSGFYQLCNSSPRTILAAGGRADDKRVQMCWIADRPDNATTDQRSGNSDGCAERKHPVRPVRISHNEIHDLAD